MNENTVNREIFVNFFLHVIIFRVKIFLYMSRPYKNILTMKTFNNENLKHNVAYAYVRRTADRRPGNHVFMVRHIYKDIANPLVGEVLQCDRDPHNTADRY